MNGPPRNKGGFCSTSTSSSRASSGGSRVNRNYNMEGSTMAARNERFNLFCRAIVAIVNSHGLTSQIYNYIREKMGEYLQKIQSLTDEVALQQSGSSYDNLHMTRLLRQNRVNRSSCRPLILITISSSKSCSLL